MDNEEVRMHVGLKFIQNNLRDKVPRHLADLRDFELSHEMGYKLFRDIPISVSDLLYYLLVDTNE
jgi:hypothetical protein